jgi:hypothetical protein
MQPRRFAMDLNWNNAKPITFEYLRSRYSFGDLNFSGLSIEGVIDGVLHLSEFRTTSDGQSADLFILFKNIRSISCEGEVHDNVVLAYDIGSANSESVMKRLRLKFLGGELRLDYQDDLLYLCRLGNDEFVDL